jgi:hypothetical protein
LCGTRMANSFARMFSARVSASRVDHFPVAGAARFCRQDAAQRPSNG